MYMATLHHWYEFIIIPVEHCIFRTGRLSTNLIRNYFHVIFYLVGHYGWGTEGSFEKKWEFKLWIFAIGHSRASSCYLRYYGKFTCCWLRWGKCPSNILCVVLVHLILLWPFGGFHSAPYVRFALAQQELQTTYKTWIHAHIRTFHTENTKKITIDNSNECISIFIWPILVGRIYIGRGKSYG